MQPHGHGNSQWIHHFGDGWQLLLECLLCAGPRSADTIILSNIFILYISMAFSSLFSPFFPFISDFPSLRTTEERVKRVRIFV